MQLSYSSFKNDILSFDFEEYFNEDYMLFCEDNSNENLNCNLNENINENINENKNKSFEIFFEFISSYKEIENEDLKKPIFSQTTKFKKNPNNYKNYKNYKYLKISRENEEVVNTWNFDSPTDESDKISVMIKSSLNKISQDTYKNISIEFIKELEEVKYCNNLFDILSKEIINKCLFDNKYRLLYINLCNKIWNNRIIHYNLVNIVNKEDNFFWDYENQTYGPFNKEIDAKNDIFNKLNFKKFFVNYIQKLYINKDLSLENLADDDFFKKKKQILLLIELISIMYLEKYISFDIINIIIIDLLHLNDNFAKIEEIEFESLYTIVKLIKEHKNINLNLNNLNEYKFIIDEFIVIINKIIENNSISKRSDFFLKATIEILSYLNQKTVPNMSSHIKNSDINLNKSKFIESIKSNNISQMENIYKSCECENTKIYFIEKLLFYILEQKNNNEVLIVFLKNMSNSFDLNFLNFLYNKINEITNNMEDILLDSPYAKERMIFILENINKNHKKRENILELINRIGNESNSDEDSDSDNEIIMR